MRSRSVLVVDDEWAILHTTEQILQKAGYTMFTADNAADAVHVLQSQHIDLLLIDCIPDSDWVISQARRVNPNMIVTVCTGDGRVRELPLVDIVLYKPVPPRALLKEFAELLCASAA